MKSMPTAQDLKNSNEYIKALAKRTELIATYNEMMLPICKEHGVQSTAEIPSEYWKSQDWKINRIVLRLNAEQITAKIIRCNRTLGRTKYSFWALNPTGVLATELS